jgi:N-methylhydantoinase A/oxoprolinase/acetone carboxylase beta subunit
VRHTIGIDIGGTNTDVVLLDSSKKCVRFAKLTTTHPLEKAVIEGIYMVLQDIPKEDVGEIYIGTTHALNALLSIESLLPVGVLRISGQKPQISAGLRWNPALRSAVIRGVETIHGGFECHGKPITPFDKKEVITAVAKLLDNGAEGIAIVSCFGTLFPQHELEAQESIHSLFGQIPMTLSSTLGGIGFIERENATILNTSLQKVIGESFSQLEKLLWDEGFAHCEFRLVQNDGSQMTVADAREKPILTLSSGPMNSAKGGSLLANCHSCVVVDIGGTSTDIVCVKESFVKRSSGVLTISDVRLRFPSPDILSLALGGGSVVDGESFLVGPKSVARNLLKEALSFGGSTLTLTDLALLSGYHRIEGADLSKISIDPKIAVSIMERQAESIADAVRVVRGEETTLPCVLVGGGAHLFYELLSTKICHLLPLDAFTGVANAFGAATAEISGHFDGVISVQERELSLDVAIQQAKDQAVKKGACPESIRMGSMAIEPLAYSKEKLAKVTVSVLGKRSKKRV